MIQPTTDETMKRMKLMKRMKRMKLMKLMKRLKRMRRGPSRALDWAVSCAVRRARPPRPLRSAPRRGFDGCSHGHGADLAPSVTRETIGSATVEADFFLVVVPGITIFLFRPRGSDPNHTIFSIKL